MTKHLLFILFLLGTVLLKSQTPTASFANWKDNNKAAYTIIHDDYSAYVSGIFQYAYPVATQRGIKFCFGAITHPDQCGPTEWANARTMIAQGHECINHTHNHLCGGSASQCSGLTTYGPADFATELGLSSQTIEANTGVKPRFFIHPYDAPSAAIETYLTGLGYLGARGGTQATYNTSAFTDFMHLNYYVYAPGVAISTLNQAVDATIAAGGYAMREFHGVNDPSWGAMTLVNYTNHLDYVKTQMTNGNIWSATASEAITYKMQRDAYQPSVVYNATTGQVNVNFTNIKTIDPSVLKTPVTVNVNLSTISNTYTVAQNGLPVSFTRSGNILSFNVYPHQGGVVLTCQGCTPVVTVPDVTNLKAVSQTPTTTSALTNWVNPTTAITRVLVVVKEGSGFTTKPVGTAFTAGANFNSTTSTVFEGGKVVYHSTGTAVMMTNLVAGKTYYVRTFVRVGTEWSNGVETTVTIPPVPNVTNLVALPQSTAAVTGWTYPTVTFTNLLVVIKAGSGFTTKPIGLGANYVASNSYTGTGTVFEGGKVVYKGKGSSVTIRNLPLGNTYYIRVFTLIGTEWSNGVETTVVIPAAAPLGSMVSNHGNLQIEQDKKTEATDNQTEIETPNSVEIKKEKVENQPQMPILNIYPNPAKDKIALDLSAWVGKTVDIQILNLLGKEVFREKIEFVPSSPHAVNIGMYEGGQYLIRVMPKGDMVAVKKLFIVH